MRLKIKVIYDLYLFECVFGSKCGWCKTYSPVSICQISDAAAPEKDEEQQLLEEKKKSIDILQSILKTTIQPQNTKKGKMFKYDYSNVLSAHILFSSYVCKGVYVPCLAFQRCFGPALRPNARGTHRFWVQDRGAEERKVLHELVS